MLRYYSVKVISHCILQVCKFSQWALRLEQFNGFMDLYREKHSATVIIASAAVVVVAVVV